MTDSNNNRTVNIPCGCGCINLIITLLCICFFISFCKNCSGRSIEESAVQTTKDYYQMADSIWNK